MSPAGSELAWQQCVVIPAVCELCHPEARADCHSLTQPSKHSWPASRGSMPPNATQPRICLRAPRPTCEGVKAGLHLSRPIHTCQWQDPYVPSRIAAISATDLSINQSLLLESVLGPLHTHQTLSKLCSQDASCTGKHNCCASCPGNADTCTCLTERRFMCCRTPSRHMRPRR